MSQWFKDRRQEFIAATLRQFGQIRRADIIRQFGVSTPQAALDIRAFLETDPPFVRYDVSAKMYVLDDDPRPAAPGTHQESRPMDPTQTYGQKAVGLSFNPSGDDAVHQCKQRFADAIDQMDELRRTANDAGNREQARLASVAITDMQTAQMWAVKALTWRD